MMLAFATAAPDLDEVSGPASGIRPKTAGFRQGLAALVGGRAGLVDRKMKADSARLTRVAQEHLDFCLLYTSDAADE